jgi:hypothetical protein
MLLADDMGAGRRLATPMHGLLLADTPADPNSTSSWAAIVIALLTIIYIVFIRPAKKKRDRDPLARQPTQTLLAQQRSIERDMTALLVEYEQMMRTMTAQIDMRTTKLDLLVREADEKIAALKAAAAATHAQPTVPQTAPTAAPADVAPVAKLPAVGETPIIKEPEAPVSAANRAENLVREARELAEAADVDVSPPADPADPHAQIYALADRGLNYRQIAHQLDRAYGEVELILALRPKNGSHAPAAEPAVIDSEAISESQSRRRNKQRRKQHSA